MENTQHIIQSAYSKLSYDELVLFLKVRKLPITGDHNTLTARLTNHDLHSYHFPSHTSPNSSPTLSHALPKCAAPDLPVEILAEIMDHVGDWELSKALGIPTSLPKPVEWSRASPADYALLKGDLTTIRSALSPTLKRHQLPTKIGATFLVRAGYVHILEYLLSSHHPLFRSLFKDDLIPIKASRHGRTAVLDWWKHVYTSHPDLVSPPRVGSIAAAIDGASRNGQVASLDWFLDNSSFARGSQSSLPFCYTDAALEQASAKNQIGVLDWWKRQHTTMGVALKIGKVMDAASNAGHVSTLAWWAQSQLDFSHDKHALYHASCHGRVEVLDWWLNSGLQMIYDGAEVLVGATKHNRPEVLSWWDSSGLPLQYRMCDIEEALEDAIGSGDQARLWWKRKGVDFGADDREWVKLKNLN